MDASDRRGRAAEEAAEWWVLLQGEVTRREREEYVDWLRESSVHVAEMLRVAQLHGALEKFQRWSEIPTAGGGTESTVVPLVPPTHTTSSPPLKHTPRDWRLAASVAAALLVVAGLTAWLLIDLRSQVIETQRGERRQVALADGSVVQVDPETRLKLDYEEHTRRVVLERGRALFHVAKNSERPFLVRVRNTTVRAVGTAFAVEEADHTVVVTVAEGRVAVLNEPVTESQLPDTASPQKTAASAVKRVDEAPRSDKPPSSGSAATEIILTANQQVTVAGVGTAEPVREVDSARVLSWAEGRLIFENESVERAVSEFNRYNRIQLNVNDAALAQRPISGVFSASDPESFVAFIQSVAAVRVTRNATDDIRIEAAKVDQQQK
jgi:transmembrane sensor